MNDSMENFLNEKLAQIRDRLLQILLFSNNPRAIEYASTWQKQGLAPPEFHRLLGLAITKANSESQKIMRICIALQKLREVKENFDNDQLVLGLDKLFVIEKLMVELEITPQLIRALGKRGGKKKAENKEDERTVARRYYRENNLVRLTDKAAGKILFSEFPIELRTAEKHAAEYRKLTNATDEMIDKISSALKKVEDEENSSPSEGIKQVDFEAYLAELSDIMGEEFGLPVNANDYKDIESYLAALKIKMLDEGGL